MTYSCHSAPEIYPGLILGGVRDVEEIVRLGAQVLVPLDFLRGEVWETGFRGEILYYPVPDGGVLPDDVLESLVEDVLGRLGEGKRLGLFCSGGHGRTGYAAACVLVRLGVSDPYKLLRGRYCRMAVETDIQVEAINRYYEKWRK